MRILLTLFFAVLFVGCSESNTSNAAYNKQKVTFPSKNILGFENLFDAGLNTQEDQEVFGVLHFPDNYDVTKPYPTIVAVHGSSNWREHHLKYIEQMRQADFIVFAIHPFDSRGVNSTVGNQINVTSETIIYEMAMSLNLLWDDPRVDNTKIYAAGWSLGGTATIFNAWMPLQMALNKPGASYAGYLMWYPGCLALPDNNDWDSDVLQIYMGEEDNYTSPKPCVQMVSEINEGGGDATITLYPRSFHSFDGPNPLHLMPEAYSWSSCNFRLNAVTKKVYDPANTELESGLEFSDPQARLDAYRSCAVKGEVMAGFSPEYRNAAFDDLGKLLPSLR
ncbi:alpha/beta hydrolase [Gammaproteobacteria bacterium]|jgi:dienelactone hydrolase|nr:alpha/beta hydrolase [Gammaproteobacteria bacterium]